MTGSGVIPPKFTKPLGGKPFVIPTNAISNNTNTKNIPVVVAVKKTQPATNKSQAKQNVQNSKPNTKKNVVVNSKDVKAVEKTSVAKSFDKKVSNNKANVTQTTNYWWDIDTQNVTAPRIVFAEEQPWYSQYPSYIAEEIEIATPDSNKVNEAKYQQIAKIVEGAFQTELSLHLKAQGKSDNDQKWINDVIKSGTLSDKVAALALRVQESPFYQLETLDILVAMACKKEQRTSQLALEALKDLLVNNLLPDRKLTYFRCNLLFHAEMNLNTALLLWFESELKTRIERIMEALDNGMKSTVDYFKKLCIEMAASLLMSKPEQEARLLTMIVNKLGDPSSKICSKCISVLRNIVSVHPAMKLVVVREVRQFIYHPNIKLKSIFNGVIFLSQVNLVRGDHNVAAQLVECYVSLFEKAVKEDELGSRLLSALLTGINKSFPFLDNIEPIAKYADSLFRLVHTASFTSSTQALMLLSHLAISTTEEVETKKKLKNVQKKVEKESEDGDEDGEDGEEGEPVTDKEEDHTGSDIMRRYYRALYAKLLSDQVTSRAKNTLLLNLLFRSIKRDPSEHRAMAFLKRLSICASQSSPSIAAGLLFLISEIMASRPKLKAMLSKTEEASLETTQEIYLDGVEEEDAHQMLGNFDASKREPEYATSARPSIWEGALMRRHFHPSVQAFAHSLLNPPEHHIVYAGDPTQDFSLMQFLNRFAYKNPKKAVSDKIQNMRRQGTDEEPVNVSKFIRSEEGDVAPDKHFYHKYFGQREKLREAGQSRDRSKKRRARRNEDSDSDVEGLDSDDDSDAEDDGKDEDDKTSKKKDKKSNKKHLNEDEEAEIDEFATQLAEQMMREQDSTFDMDPDMDDFSEDEEGDSDDSAVDSGNEMSEQDSDDQENSDDDEDDSAADSDDDDNDEHMLEEYQSSDSDEEEEEEKQPVLSKKQQKVQEKSTVKSNKKQNVSDAMDFEDYLKQQAVTKSDSKSKSTKDNKKDSNKNNKKKNQPPVESDSDSDGDFAEPEMYHSDDDHEEDKEVPVVVKKGKKATTATAAAKAIPVVAAKDNKKDTKTKKGKQQQQQQEDVSDDDDDDDDDLSVMEFNSDDSYSSFDEDEEFDLLCGEGVTDKSKTASKKANNKKDTKSKKGDKKRKRDRDEGDFASADDYENQMDDILKQIQNHNAGGSTADDEKKVVGKAKPTSRGIQKGVPLGNKKFKK